MAYLGHSSSALTLEVYAEPMHDREAVSTLVGVPHWATTGSRALSIVERESENTRDAA